LFDVFIYSFPLIAGQAPEGAIMIFSGLGPDAQNQISIGVGALAGSTIMLLTIPWSFVLIAGSFFRLFSFSFQLSPPYFLFFPSFRKS
jgi:hypothetical protein